MTHSYPTVLAFGELLWDLLPDGKVIGGAPANFAYRLSELGDSVGLISRVGSDAMGDEALEALRIRGVPVNYIQVDESRPTGTVNVTLSPSGDASYVIVPGVAYDWIEATPALVDAAKQARAICYGTLVQRAPGTREALYTILDAAKDAAKIVDINLRKDCFSADTIKKSLEYADILKLNREEVRVLGELLSLDASSAKNFSQQAIDRFHLRLVLVTQGSDGVLGFDAQGEEVSVPGYSVSVADTVGSGDNFTAGFVHKYLGGADLESCCEFANRVGALTASKKGGMPKISKSEIESLPTRHDAHAANV